MFVTISKEATLMIKEIRLSGVQKISLYLETACKLYGPRFTQSQFPQLVVTLTSFTVTDRTK